MTSDVVFFYVYGLVALAGAIGLVTAPKLVHAVMSLLATLLSIAALYLLMGSEFLAAMQLFVYGGAITVLALFVLMLTNPEQQAASRSSRGVVLTAGGLCVVLFGLLATTLLRGEWNIGAIRVHDTASLATILFSRYVLPFELAGLVLTIALVGAIVLAREDDLPDMVLSPDAELDGAHASAGLGAATAVPAASPLTTGALAEEAGDLA